MADNDQNQPKIIVDDDWKAEAQREKEEADRQARETADQGMLPEPHLYEIIQMIALQASIGLGGMTDPQTGQRIPAQLPLAKHYIDLLALFQQKTANNLDETESKMIEGALHELHLAFVQVAGLGSGDNAAG
jgi:hypothetical protein